MPRLSIADCEALVRALDEQPVMSLHARRAAARLRQRLEEAHLSRGVSSRRVSSGRREECGGGREFSRPGKRQGFRARGHGGACT